MTPLRLGHEKHRLARRRSTFLFLCLGASIGLGDIWQFPYLVTQYGGLAFALVYLLALWLLGRGLLMLELAVGKLGRSDVVGTLNKLAHKNGLRAPWPLLGWVHLLAGFLAFCFSVVMGGLALAHLFSVVTGVRYGVDDLATPYYLSALQSGDALAVWLSLFLALVLLVSLRGWFRGVGHALRIAGPVLLVLPLVLLALLSIHDHARFIQAALFHFSWQELGLAGVVAAFAQAFFSLALGVGVMVLVGASLPRRINISELARDVVALDALFAWVLALCLLGLFSGQGFEVSRGFTLLFHDVPELLAKTPGGQAVGTLFFLMVVLAAWTTSLTLFETVVIWLQRQSGHRRSAAVWVGAMAAWLLALLLAYSLSHPGTWPVSLYALLNQMTSLVLVPGGSLLLLLMLSWTAAGRWPLLLLRVEKRANLRAFSALVKYLLPVLMAAIMAAHFYDF